MNEVIYYSLRGWIYLREFCCPRKKSLNDVKTSYTSTWEDEAAAFNFKIEIRTYGNGLVRRVVHPRGEENTTVLTPSRPPPPPWFFIGCYDSARSLQDKTYEMDEYIYPGNKITLELLQRVFPGSQRWVYIHPQTFEETEFPSEGIVIENDEDGDERDDSSRRS